MNKSRGFVEDEAWAGDALSLILFVHLAIAGDADKGLGSTGLNRTHHRILFLVAHSPGVTVGELVSLLRITAQAIGAPLRTLIDSHLIEQQSSERDRRRRHLIITDEGRKFLDELSRKQFARIAEARRKAGDESFDGFMRMMRCMMDEADRDWLFPPSETATGLPRVQSGASADKGAIGLRRV